MPGYRYWWAYAEKSPYDKKYFEGQWEIHERLKEKNRELQRNRIVRTILRAFHRR
jgi:hypothetical protein